MENKSITKEIVVSKGHEFERTFFYDISVIKHIKTGFYSANFICKSNRKKFKNIKRNQYWVEYCDKLKKYLNNSIGSQMSQYNLDGNNVIFFELLTVSKEFKGTYIHPLLLNFLCEHVDYEYAIKVSHLMLLINEESKLRNITLEDKIIEIEESVELLKNENKIQNNMINKQKEMINTYKQTVDLNNEMIKSFQNTIDLNNEVINKHKDKIKLQTTVLDELNDKINENEKLIENKCVNTKTDSRRFRIYDITEYEDDEKRLDPMNEKCKWKVSASQDKNLKYPILLEVILVSSMHGRIDLKDHLYVYSKHGNRVFQKSKEFVYKYITSTLKPKSIKIDNIRLN